jgi:dihydroorotate dehydrogenase electron transfer subunit
LISCSPGRVIDNERLAEGLYLLRLESVSVAPECHPGQFVMLRSEVPGWPYLKRPFSVYNSDGEAAIELVYKVVGRATAVMASLGEGDQLEVTGPLGRGFNVSAEVSQGIAVAGGIGMPPLGFYCHRYVGVLEKLTLVVGAQTRAELLLPVGLTVQGVEILAYTEDGSKGTRGTACDGLRRILDHLSPASDSVQVVSCGPKEMLYQVHRICTDIGIACQISVETIMACGVGACRSCAIPASGGGYLHACQDGPVLESRLLDWERWLG